MDHAVPMDPFADTAADRRRRERMLRDQLGDCDDPRVREAMAAVPRQWFVPPAAKADAYADSAMAIGAGQTISQPRVVAYMLAQLAVEPGQHVLDVGCGSGYAAALLARLAGPRGFVDAVERQPLLVAGARAVLSRCGDAPGSAPIVLHHADGGIGLPERGPFDRIHVACAHETVPPALLEQLAPDGRLIMPVGPEGEQELRLITRDGDAQPVTERLWAVRFVPLLEGAEGAEDEP